MSWDCGVFDAKLICETNFALHWDDRELETGEDFLGLSLTILDKIVCSIGGNFHLSRDGKIVSLNIIFRVITGHLDNELGEPVNFSSRSVIERMLIVDDSTINRKILAKYLLHVMESDKENIHIDEAEDGQVALDMVKTFSHYDIIWMDIVMPKMDGILACREIKKIKNEIPVIMVTANESHTFPEDFEYDGYIQKPVIKSDLLDILQNIFPVA